jgi:hypothetical protein
MTGAAPPGRTVLSGSAYNEIMATDPPCGPDVAESSGCQTSDGLRDAQFGLSDRHLPLLAAHFKTFRCDDVEVVHTNERECTAQVGLRVLHCLRGRTIAVETTACNGQEYTLVPGQAFRLPEFRIAKCLSGDSNAIDPRLQLAGDREVLEGHSNYHDVSGKELLHDRLAQCKILE